LPIVRELCFATKSRPETREKLESATDYVESAIADRHGSGEVAAKIQAHIIVAGI